MHSYLLILLFDHYHLLPQLTWNLSDNFLSVCNISSLSSERTVDRKIQLPLIPDNRHVNKKLLFRAPDSSLDPLCKHNGCLFSGDDCYRTFESLWKFDSFESPTSAVLDNCHCSVLEAVKCVAKSRHQTLRGVFCECLLWLTMADRPRSGGV